MTPGKQEQLGIDCPKCGHTLFNPGSNDIPSSTAPEIMHTNHSTSQLEAQLMKSRLEEMNSGIRQLNNDIERLQAFLASLTQQRDDLQQCASRHQGAVSSIRRFPPEILAEIYYQLDRPVFRKAYPPAQVCRFWREVAFSTASLWTSFELPLKQGREELEMQVAQRWLSSSGELPIKIKLGELRTNMKASSHPCVKLLAAHAHRWQSAEIFSIPPAIMRDLRSIQHNLPLLETLSIGEFRPSMFPSVPPIQFDCGKLFIDAPQLHTLKLCRGGFGQTFYTPWTQLTVLWLEGAYHLHECYDIIQSCPDLWTCDLCISTDPIFNNIGIDHRPILVLDNLKDLKNHEGDCLEELLDRLELPSLDRFSHIECQDGPQIYHVIASLFARSVSPLRRLEIDSPAKASAQDLIECLWQCPDLEELSLLSSTAHGISVLLLWELTYQRDSGETLCCLAPKLHTITVCVLSEFSFEAFTTMVESRWRYHGLTCQGADHQDVVQIKQATLRRMPDAHAQDAIADMRHREPRWLEVLRELQGEGFSLNTQDDTGYWDIPLGIFVQAFPDADSE